MLFNWLNPVGKQCGAYLIEKRLGEGRYGKCFLARQADGKPVVLKRFKFSLRTKRAQRSVHEAVILSSLQEDTVPTFLGVINERGFYGFVLEYMEGQTLKDLLFKDGRKFADDEVYDLGLQLIKIVKRLHAKGIVHRDIRPANIILQGNQISLIDFGLARFSDPHHCPFNLDFSYLGDVILYLLYSSYESVGDRVQMGWKTSKPWYEELTLSEEKKWMLKRLMGLEVPYDHIEAIEADFKSLFQPTV